MPAVRGCGVGWGQEVVAARGRGIWKRGSGLDERLSSMSGHFVTMGGKRGDAVSAYNKAVGSLESRVLVSARKLRRSRE